MSDWIRAHAPAPVLVQFITCDWLRNLRDKGPWAEHDVGDALAIDPAGGFFLFSLLRITGVDLFAELWIDEDTRSIRLLTLAPSPPNLKE